MQKNRQHTDHGKRNAILLFTRSPLSEARVKRIERLGMARRVQLYTALTQHTINRAQASGYELVVASDTQASLFHQTGIRHVLNQHGRGFGERLENAVRETLALGYDRIAVIGNDSPGLDSDLLCTAFRNHSTGDLGLCKAADGGVTLITLDRQTLSSLPELFDTPRWETGFVYEDLVRIAQAHGIAILSLGHGRDIDSSADLLRAACAVETSAILRVFARILRAQPLDQRLPFRNFTLSSRRILRICRQKAPPVS